MENVVDSMEKLLLITKYEVMFIHRTVHSNTVGLGNNKRFVFKLKLIQNLIFDIIIPFK